MQTQLAHRNGGIGSALMHRLRGIARDEMGLEQLHLAVRGGTGLEDFYARLGWHQRRDPDGPNAAVNIRNNVHKETPSQRAGVLFLWLRDEGLSDRSHECLPGARGEHQRPAVAVGGVTDEDHAVLADFDAATTVTA